MSEYTRFERHWPLTRVLIPFARAMSVYFRARAFGQERIPAHDPVIFVAKHPRSFLYLETLMLALYTFWDNDRPPIRVLEKRGTAPHKTPLVGWMRRNVNAIPAAEDHALEALRHGESLLIYPGGARELYGPADQLCWEGRTGFARLAIEAQVSVVPLAIVGADQQHPFHVRLGQSTVWLPPFPLPVRLEYRFGYPIAPPPKPRSSTPAIGTAQADHAAIDLAARVLEATQMLLSDGIATRGRVAVHTVRHQTSER